MYLITPFKLTMYKNTFSFLLFHRFGILPISTILFSLFMILYKLCELFMITYWYCKTNRWIIVFTFNKVKSYWTLSLLKEYFNISRKATKLKCVSLFIDTDKFHSKLFVLWFITFLLYIEFWFLNIIIFEVTRSIFTIHCLSFFRKENLNFLAPIQYYFDHFYFFLKRWYGQFNVTYINIFNNLFNWFSMSN